VKAYQPIACHQYDYIEIACLNAYQLELELITGELVKGIAITTSIKDKQEFLVLTSNLEGRSPETMVRLIK